MDDYDNSRYDWDLSKKIQAKLDMTVLNQQFGKDSEIVKWLLL